MSQDLNSIKARLGSISDTTKRHLPKAVLKILEEDMPRLVEVAEKHGELLPQSPEQQIKDIPW